MLLAACFWLFAPFNRNDREQIAKSKYQMAKTLMLIRMIL